SARVTHLGRTYRRAEHLAFKGRAVRQNDRAAVWISESLRRSTIPKQQRRISGVDVRTRFAPGHLFAKTVKRRPTVGAVAVIADHSRRREHIIGGAEHAIGSGVSRSRAVHN